MMKQNNGILQEMLRKLKSLSAHLGILDGNEINEASEVAAQQDPTEMEIHQMFDGLSTPTNTKIVDKTIEDRFGGSIDVVAIINCVDFVHDLVIAAEVNASGLIREVATEYGVGFDVDHVTMVMDHTGYTVSKIEGGHTLIASGVILESKEIIDPVFFQDIGHSLKYGSAMFFVSVVQVLIKFHDPYQFRLLLMDKNFFSSIEP
ncbi:hypothetical protein GQ457_15G016030 [Hibiscus cannabinus]